MNHLTIHPIVFSFRRLVATLILLHLTLAAPGRAQDLDDITISGRIFDSHGAVIPGAIITATGERDGRRRTAAAGGDGFYRIIELEPGRYRVRVSSDGFTDEEKTVLGTIAGRNVRIDFTLRPAGVAATAEVIIREAEAPLVDTTRTIVGATVARAELESLPSPSRAPLDFVFTLGGVAEEPLSTRDAAEDRDPAARAAAARSSSTPEEAGIFSLSGGAASSNNITIDGLDNTDDRAARERFQPSLEAIEEVQVIANQFSAEYGRASGGRVNLRTRGGTRDLRGRLFYFFRDEALDANTFNNNRRGLARLPLQEHIAGFTLSGPVSFPRRYLGPLGSAAGRERTAFFVAGEFGIVLDTAMIDTLVPVESNPLYSLPGPTSLAGRRTESAAAAAAPGRRAAELAPFVERVATPARNQSFTARVDHKFTETHNGALLYQRGRQVNLRQFGGGLRLAEGLQGRSRSTDALSYSDNLVFSAKTVNQLRVQVSRLAPAFKTSGGGRGRPVVLIAINDPLEFSDPADRSGTLVAGPSTAGATERRETRWQIQNVLTLLPHGAHTLKLGGDVQFVRTTFTDLSDTGGTYNFASASDFLAGTPSRYRQRFGAESVQRNVYTGLFVQDEWRVRSNLTFSYGLRYDNESIVSDRNNWAPRAALAYDPFNSGKTVIRLGAGVFFNRALLRAIDDFTLGNQSVVFDTNVLPPAARRSFIDGHLRFPEVLAPDSTLVSQIGVRPIEFTRRLDPRLRIPESYQANLGFEREIAASHVVVEANYTFNRALHLWREFNANAPVLPRGYRDFAAYLQSRDFANFRNRDGARPIYNAAAAGEFVRFTDASFVAADSDGIGQRSEHGLPITIFNLNSVASTVALEAALGAIGGLRPDPSRGQIEQLASIGNSFYHALTLGARRRFARPAGFGFSLRAAYTLSRLIDDGVVNTSSALTPGDFRAERARSLLDRRHRFVFSGTFATPRRLGRVLFSPIWRMASGAPFNISSGGVDRNLDDVNNDRPVFTGDVRRLRARRAGELLDPGVLNAFSLPTIGQTGNLPRNAGRGPNQFVLDLNVTREFRAGGARRLRPVVEIDNLLNKTVFTFGAEFINFNALGASATPAQRQAVLDTFLVPTRTLRPRRLRLGLRFDF